MELNDICVGQCADFTRLITENDVETFARLSGDYNPLHMDSEYAGSTKFKRRIVHGMLASSFFSTLVGMYIPGKNALYMSQTLRFLSPLFLGDEVVVSCKVLDKSESTRIITLQTQLHSGGVLKVDGIAKVMVL